MNPVEKLKNFVADAKRIFTVSRKPSMEEYKRMTLIVAIGIIAIGVIAFIIYLFFALTGIGFWTNFFIIFFFDEFVIRKIHF